MKKLAFVLFLLLIQTTVLHAEETLTPQLVATKFNLRTIYSSFGQVVSKFCESYPDEFFSDDSITYDDNRVIFENKINYFVLEIIGDDEIEVSDQILPPGNYYSNTKYKVFFDKEHGDIRATQTFIPVPSPCVPYPKEP